MIIANAGISLSPERTLMEIDIDEQMEVMKINVSSQSFTIQRTIPFTVHLIHTTRRILYQVVSSYLGTLVIHHY